MPPRIRSIKPELWDDEGVGGLSFGARLLYLGAITQADDEGRFRARPPLLRARVFPYDDISSSTVAGWLAEIAAAELAVLYESDGEMFGSLCGWRAHQHINRPTPSTIPPPPESTQQFYRPAESPRRESTDPTGSPRSESVYRAGSPRPDSAGEPSGVAFHESSVSPHGVLSEPSLRTHEGREGKGEDLGRERKGAQAPRAREPQPGAPDLCLEQYLALLQRHHPRFADEFAVSRELFQASALLPDLATFERRLIAWAASEQWREEGGRYAPKPARWVRDGGFRGDPPPPRPRRTTRHAAVEATPNSDLDAGIIDILPEVPS